MLRTSEKILVRRVCVFFKRVRDTLFARVSFHSCEAKATGIPFVRSKYPFSCVFLKTTHVRFSFASKCFAREKILVRSILVRSKSYFVRKGYSFRTRRDTLAFFLWVIFCAFFLKTTRSSFSCVFSLGNFLCVFFKRKSKEKILRAKGISCEASIPYVCEKKNYA